MQVRRSPVFHRLEAAKAQKRLLLTQLDSERAAERAAKAAGDTAKATKDSSIYMLFSVILLALSSMISFVIAIINK
jgi:hypothetical protein